MKPHKDFRQIKIICPRDHEKIYDMEIVFLTLSDGTKINAPCNGCEWLHECPECYDCTSKITSLFFYHPDFCSHSPINPASLPDNTNKKS